MTNIGPAQIIDRALLSLAIVEAAGHPCLEVDHHAIQTLLASEKPLDILGALSGTVVQILDFDGALRTDPEIIASFATAADDVVTNGRVAKYALDMVKLTLRGQTCADHAQVWGDLTFVNHHVTVNTKEANPVAFIGGLISLALIALGQTGRRVGTGPNMVIAGVRSRLINAYTEMPG